MPSLDNISTPVRMAGFLAALAVVFTAALGVGAAVGPIGDSAPSTSYSTDQHPTDQGRSHPGSHTP